MQNKQTHMPDRIAFIADAHLGEPGEDGSRTEKVAAFLRGLRGGISHLYIVGDLFDFWFEYRSVVPNIAPHVVFELYNLVQTGTDVTLLGGNHDYWLGPYLRDSVGLTLAPNDISVEHQGRKIYLHHGDGLYPGDYGYRLLKKVLRNPVSIYLFRLLHPDLARGIARLTSSTSRSYLAPPRNVEYYRAIFEDIADRRLNEGYDAVVYGHSHIPLVEMREKGTMILLGDWIKYDTYVILENGEFNIRTWNASGENENG